MRAYWWPVHGSATTVTSYATTIDEVGGSGDVAFVRGSGDLTMADASGSPAERTSRSVFLMVARRDDAGAVAHRRAHVVARARFVTRRALNRPSSTSRLEEPGVRFADSPSAATRARTSPSRPSPSLCICRETWDDSVESQQV